MTSPTCPSDQRLRLTDLTDRQPITGRNVQYLPRVLFIQFDRLIPRATMMVRMNDFTSWKAVNCCRPIMRMQWFSLYCSSGFQLFAQFCLGKAYAQWILEIFVRILVRFLSWVFRIFPTFLFKFFYFSRQMFSSYCMYFQKRIIRFILRTRLWTFCLEALSCIINFFCRFFLFS